MCKIENLFKLLTTKLLSLHVVYVIYVYFSMQEFLGCTSFGLRHLKKAEKDVNGWYHLLTEDVGCKKHLQMTTRQRQTKKHTGMNCCV